MAMESLFKNCGACLSGVLKDLLEPSGRDDLRGMDGPRSIAEGRQSKPKPILDRTELPDSWKSMYGGVSNGSLADSASSGRKDSSGDGTFSQRKTLGRHTYSLPGMLAADTQHDDERKVLDTMPFGRAKSLRHDAVEEQDVELIVTSSSCALEAASNVVVVFENVPAGATTEFRLECRSPKKEDRGEWFWGIPFVRTGLEPGVYAFFFLVDGVRQLSKTYPVIGDVNMAMFSDPLRRYIVAHRLNLEQSASDRSPTSIFRSFATNGGQHSDKENSSKPTTAGARRISNKQRERLERGMSSMKRANSIQGVYLAGEEASLDSHERDVPMFSDDVYSDIYDHELRLRLDPTALYRLDWEAAPLGGPCLGNARLWAGSARMGKKLGECEDACFVSQYALGVADGVGGMASYADFGMNSAQFAADLMRISRDACLIGEEQCANSARIPPEEMALNAMRVANEKTRSFGAATMLVAVVSQSILGVANLGDSGFMVLRRGKHRLEIVSRSKEQHHRWNCPYQLTRLPQLLSEKFPGFICDMPDDSQRYCTRLHQGDLVLMFSDGLKDNLHDHEILHIVERSLSPPVSQLLGMQKYKTAPDALAQALVQAAHERSCDPRARVPFGNYCREHGFSHEGGKMDDITVVAAWVLDQ